ncbi:MAG: hypothetical protein ACK47B_23915 [Armatimonadota bacterium]
MADMGRQLYAALRPLLRPGVELPAVLDALGTTLLTQVGVVEGDPYPVLSEHQLRHRRRRERALSDELISREIIGSLTDRAEVEERISAAHLTREEAQSLTLSAQLGVAEAAAFLGMPERTVKRRSAAAREKLRRVQTPVS